jgi:hypothetical protein
MLLSVLRLCTLPSISDEMTLAIYSEAFFIKKVHMTPNTVICNGIRVSIRVTDVHEDSNMVFAPHLTGVTISSIHPCVCYHASSGPETVHRPLTL